MRCLPGIPIDLGAMIIVGTEGNPLITLAQQVGSRLHVLNRSRCPLYDCGVEVDPKLDQRVENLFNKMMATAAEKVRHVPRRVMPSA